MKSGLLAKFLEVAVRNYRPVLLTGSPGVGKTDIVKLVAMLAGFRLIISHPVVADPSDAKGLAWPAKDGKSAAFIPIGQMFELLNAKEPTIWFLDDLGQATPAVQAAYMQWILAREVNGHRIPDCVTILAATNRRQDKAGVSSILEPVKGRFKTIIELEPCIKDWTQWAITTKKVAFPFIAFLGFRPELLSAFVPTAEMTNSPTPRNWQSASELYVDGVPNGAELEVYSGSVGSSAATELTGFLRIMHSLPNPDAVMLNPMGADVPEAPNVMWALGGALCERVNVHNYGRFLQFTERVHKGGSGEFAAWMVKFSMAKHPEVQHTPEFMQMIAGDLGQLVNA